MTDRIAEDERARKARIIRKYSKDALKYARKAEEAIALRDQAMIDAHGDKNEGGLSYEDMAEASGDNDEERIGRGRVIQIVQGKSEYSKRQPKRARVS